jgi:hypothetical protein
MIFSAFKSLDFFPSGLCLKMERGEGRHGRRCRVAVVGRANSGRCTTIDFLMAHSEADWVPSLIGSLCTPSSSSGPLTPIRQTSLEQVKAELERGEPVSNTRGRGPAEKLAIVDVSGHKDFVKNLVVGTTQADLVLLFVSAAPGEFEAGLAEVRLNEQFGPRPQSLRSVGVPANEDEGAPGAVPDAGCGASGGGRQQDGHGRLEPGTVRVDSTRAARSPVGVHQVRSRHTYQPVLRC